MTDRDIQMVAIGGQTDRVLALKNGRVAATILNPANALMLEKAGFKTILDMEDLEFPGYRQHHCRAPQYAERPPTAGGEIRSGVG